MGNEDPLDDSVSLRPSTETNEAPSLRLLLHCVDGVVPYLTPHLLEKYFPAHRFGNVLSLGLAVRDTCIAPIYTEQAKDKEHSRKVRGYAFSTTTKPDPWLLPYHRVTVCTFDMLQDAQRAMEDSGMESVSKRVYVTEKQVQLWTANGRTSLKPEQYREACLSLNSQIQVPLFDCFVPETVEDSGDLVADRKRQQRKLWNAIKQTQRFTEDFLSSSSPWAGVWMPVLAEGIIIDEQDALKEQLKWMNELEGDTNVAGIVLLGWHMISQAHKRESVLQEVKKHLISEKKLADSSIVILNVLSLKQLFEVVLGAGDVNTVIGTKLPEKWAQSRKAFVLQLGAESEVEESSSGNEPQSKKQRTDEESLQVLDENGCFALDGAADNKEASMHPWFRDTRPLYPGCKCLTCQLHTRSYVYHMVCAKELLAEILLFNHNLHHMLILLEKLHKARRMNTVREYINSLQVKSK